MKGRCGAGLFRLELLVAKKSKKLPVFGDREVIARIHKDRLPALIDQERKINGKVFTVRVEFTKSTDEIRDIDVIALDDSDAEIVACDTISEKESGVDRDDIETRVLSVREQDAESKTLELFPKV